MEASKAFIAKHTSRRGHKTEVLETVRPAITREQIRPHRHEITTEAIDKEVHQHHYHTVVQPLSHTVTLPTKHTHNLLPIKHTTHQHDDVEATKRRVEADAARFKSSSTMLPVTHSQQHMPAVVGTHHHHHVHEFVQPIIYKETIVPEVVHTTIPIHEHHHMKAEHHTMSALPSKTMAEFEALKSHTRGTTTYDGPPRPYESKFHTTLEMLGLVTKEAVATPKHADNKMTIDTSHQKPLMKRSGSSTSSASSLSSMEQPLTPRSPRMAHKHSKPMANMDTPIKHVDANRAVHVVDSTSPRLSNESAGSGSGRLSNSWTR